MRIIFILVVLVLGDVQKFVDDTGVDSETCGSTRGLFIYFI
jgi:hypothetical protein